MYEWLPNSCSFSLMEWILNILWDFQMPTTEPLTTIKHFSCILVIWCLASLLLPGIENITPSRAVKKWKIQAGVDKPILKGPSGLPWWVQMVKNLPAMQETWVRSLVQEDPLEREMAIHSNILAWRISWTGEPGGLQSVGSQESDTTEQLTHTYTQRSTYSVFQKLS